MKDKSTAIILSALLGGLGVDRFYLGYAGMGVLKLLTGGLFGILWIIDIVRIANGTLLPADGSEYASEAGRPAAPSKSPYDELEKLAHLHNQGALTDEEFKNMKAALMRTL